MKRTLSFFVLAALIALPACSSRSAVAASINGTDISVEDLNRDVGGFAQSEDFRSALAEQGVTLKRGDRVPTSFAAQWLQSMIQSEAIAQIAKKRGVTATAEEKAAAKAQLSATGASGDAFKQLPAGLRRRIVNTSALQGALRSALPQPSNDAAAAQAFETLRADCTSNALVGHILVATPEAAQQVVDQLEQGITFAAVSTALSTDTGAKAQDGLLMCIGSSQWPQIDETFRAAAEATPVGEISEPVQTEFGVHVIEVLEFNQENARALVAAGARPPDPLAEIVGAYIRKAKITVNPRYGTLKKSDGGFSIEPPTPKEPKSRPSKNSTQTTAPGTPQPPATPPDVTSTTTP